MIPRYLSLSGFLSYRDPVEVDFTRFDLACISGHNGAGKSSLLDAITWAIFGQARKTGEALIHSAANAAEVSLVFEYEGNTYRIQRTLPKGKTTILEFQIQQPLSGRPGTQAPAWKPLTERTLRDTQARIEQTLRLDYETFVNASFFLQGKADLFTQQRPSDRKRILASILGLEIWEGYRQRASERRKRLETDVAALDGRLAEIAAELGEEESRKTQLEALQAQLALAAKSRGAQEAALENYRRLSAALAEQRKLVETLARQFELAQRRAADLAARLAGRQAERETFTRLRARAPAIQAAYADWTAARGELEKWEAVAAQFRQHEKRRQPFLDEINAARARLLQEQQTLTSQQTAIQREQEAMAGLQAQIGDLRQQVSAADARLAERAGVENQLNDARARQAEARAENPRLKTEMDELKERIDQLSAAEGANCPVCGQPLSGEERQRLIADLTQQGRAYGDRYRANQSLLREADQQMAQLEGRIKALSAAEQARTNTLQALAGLTARLEALQAQVETWEREGAPRLAAIAETLGREDYGAAARLSLAEVDAELKATGYDAAAHDAARQSELQGRAAESDLRALERALAALEPLDRELSELRETQRGQQEEQRPLQAEYDASLASLAAAQAAAPDLHQAESELLAIQEQENRLRMEVGAARQKVAVLGDLKTRRKSLEAQREHLARLIGQYRQLERAFGKDGVPALLIEQALPQIEARANDLLDRLSGGVMTVRFVTQAAYKDKRRDDLKETLDIHISDGAGTRDYEMYSGGEAFRVNFAIRLALSEVLAQRAGARLQTLVIDEGFGSQDAQGRQRLIEAINLVKPDFAKILVITHIDELKDAFPSRLEVEKTERGSLVRVI